MNLDIRNLTKSFDNNQILKDISIRLNNIHSLAVIGPSGGGKSTFLRILAGLEKPDSGTIRINNWNIDFREEYLKNYRKNIGMVFQSYNLFPHLTAMRNITLPLEKVHKVSTTEAVERAERLLRRFQLLDHAHKKPHELSGGQKQRAAIARAIAINSEFLLLDEPTSALDPMITKEVLDTINDLKREEKDLILVTHEMGFARQACDYTLFIADGKIIEHGESKKLFSYPETKELKEFLNEIFLWN